MTRRKGSYPEKSLKVIGHKSILVVCETWEGRVTPLSLALLGEARTIVRRVSTYHEVYAAVFGQVEDLGSNLGPYGAKTVFQCPVESNFCDSNLVVAIVNRLTLEYSSSLVLFVRSPWSVNVAPRIAVELQAPLISNCVGVEWSPENGITAMTAIQSGRLYRQCSAPGEDPIIISWYPESLGRYERQEGLSAEVVKLAPVSISDSGSVQSLKIIEGDPKTISLEEADRVLAFGRGMDSEDLPNLQLFAQECRASMGGTRPVIDAGLLPFERQIGQTGMMVSPGLLFAWGVSGANEFTVGIEDAQIVVAVNKDSQARIFSFSDLGLVGDGKKILQEILKQLETEDIDKETDLKEVP